jgi:hypothetical protein
MGNLSSKTEEVSLPRLYSDDEQTVLARQNSEEDDYRLRGQSCNDKSGPANVSTIDQQII